MGNPPVMKAENLRKRWLELDAMRNEIVAEQDIIKAAFREALDLGKTSVGDGYVTVTPNRRFSTVTAHKVLNELNPDLVTACSVNEINAKKAKEILPPAVYEQCMTDVGDRKVTIA